MGPVVCLSDMDAANSENRGTHRRGHGASELRSSVDLGSQSTWMEPP